MGTEEKQTLHDFGLDFQTKCIASLLADKAFLDQTFELLETDFFEREADQWIVGIIKKHYLEYKSAPSLTVFRVEIDAVEHDILKKSVVDQLKESFKKMEDDDITYVKKKFLEFAKNQYMAHALLEAVDLHAARRHDEIIPVLNRALKAGMDKDIGHDYFEMVDVRMSEMARIYIPTGWELMDDLMDGGLAKGELGIVVAPAGSGKSWLLARLGCEAVKQGKNVIHYTLELNQNYVGLRYDSCFTGVSFQEIREHEQLVRSKIFNPEYGWLVIKNYASRSKTCQSLKMHIERTQMLKNTPADLIIVDYADLLLPTNVQKNSNTYLEAGSVYEELRTLAGELQLPIWSASQTNRGAHEQKTIQAQNVADSYRKVMTADFVFSLARNMENKSSNTANIHIIKNRFGADGMNFPTKFDASNGTINMYDANSGEGMEISRKLKNAEECVQGKMRDMYNKMKNNKWNSQPPSSEEDEENND